MSIDCLVKGYYIYTLDKQDTITDKDTLNRLIARIHEMALDSANIAFSEHAVERGIKRGISFSEARQVLKTGQFSQSVTCSDREYRFQITSTIAERTIAVQAVCQIDMTERVFVITVFEIKRRKK